jgi:hypothetical protein
VIEVVPRVNDKFGAKLRIIRILGVNDRDWKVLVNNMPLIAESFWKAAGRSSESEVTYSVLPSSVAKAVIGMSSARTQTWRGAAV